MVAKKTKGNSDSSSLTSSKPKSTRKTLQSCLGLVFPVTRIRRYIRIHSSAPRVDTLAGISMTAALEYMCAEVLEAAMLKAELNSRKRITPADLISAFQEDAELSMLLPPEAEMYQGDVFTVKERRKRRTQV